MKESKEELADLSQNNISKRLEEGGVVCAGTCQSVSH